MPDWHGPTTWDTWVRDHELSEEEEAALLDFVVAEGEDPDVLAPEALDAVWRAYRQRLRGEGGADGAR